MKPRSLPLAALVLLLAPGCVAPAHLQYDYGRAYQQSMQIQANLDRPSAAGATYPMSGAEAILIMGNVAREDAAQKTITPIEPALVTYPSMATPDDKK